MILTKEYTNSINLDSLVQDRIKTDRLNELLLVVPTNRKIRSLKKEIINLTPSKVSGKINLETLGTLSQKLLLQNRQYRMLSEAASAVLISKSVKETELKYFSAYKYEIPYGTLDRIKNVISEYKKSGLTPDAVLKNTETLSGSEKWKALDIANIFRVYNKNCSDLSVMEIGDVYATLNSLLMDQFVYCFRVLYPEVNLIIVNGFDEFTIPEIQVLDSISGIQGIKLYINFDYSSANNLIFSHLDECYLNLRKKGFRFVEDSSRDRLDNFRQKLRDKLFIYNNPDKRDKRFEDKINIIFAPDREQEVSLIAKEIKLLLSKKKTEPHRICVAFNLITGYSPAIRDIFNVYGIPFNLTDRLSLKDSFPVNTIINYLEIFENDFYYKNVFRALSGSFVNTEGIDLSALMKSAAELKIISGYQNWISSLTDALQVPADEDEDDYSREKNRNIFKKALTGIESLYHLLEPFGKKMSHRDFLAALRNLIKVLDIPKRLIADLSNASEENIKAITVFLESLEEIFSLLEMENKIPEKYSLKYFIDQIKTAASTARFNIKEQSDFGVLVTSLNEIRGLKFEYLFIAGLCDGDFPTRYSPEIFLPEIYARKETEHQTEERYHFYQSLCCWEKGLFLTYPAKDKEMELVESGFIREFKNLYETGFKNAEYYSPFIFSREELLILAGKYGVEKTKEMFQDIKEINWSGIENSIRVNSARNENPLVESAYNGFLLADDTGGFVLSDQSKNELLKLGTKQFSVTQLELYAGCPYQYFMKRVLNLDVLKEPAEEIEAFELGTLLHSILSEFYKKMTGIGIVLQGCNDKQFHQAENLLFRVAEEIVSGAMFGSPLSFFEREKILGINSRRENSILYQFLKYERENSKDFVPSYFEQEFNSGDDSGEVNTKLSIGDINIRGKIDRIEINKKDKLLNVVDYKRSGKKPTQEDLINGISLQLPIYMFVASEIIKASSGQEYRNAGAYIYSLKYKEGEFGKILISNHRGNKNFDDLSTGERAKLFEYNELLIQKALESVIVYTRKIKNGIFNISELDNKEGKVCKYCDFRSICRVQEI